MKSLELRKNFYWTGIVDDTLRVFDIIMYTEFGTTYNSYVLKAGDKTILFETAKAKFFDSYLETLKEIVDIRKIDYLVVDHTEPDHAGSVEMLLKLNPGLKIIGTGCAIGFLKEIVNADFTAIPVKDNQTMKIGDKTLRFLVVPNLHWPDTMYTYIEEEQILVTCDSFGSHYGFHDVLVSKVTDHEGYMRATKYYFDNIIGPFKPFMQKALKRVRDLDITMICPGHGPVLNDKIDFMLRTYEEWCDVKNPNPRKTVVIPYVSAYGYTKLLAEKIAEGIRDSQNVDVRCYDMVEADQAKVLEELLFADGILFGTPTIVGEALKPIWDLTTSIFAGTHGGKLASAFGSYGWSGEGVPHLLERLKQLRMNVVDGFKVRFKPSENDFIDAYEYGYQFGCLLQNKENPRKAAHGARQLVKCLVCGEIFDSSLDICPVCGVGRENFVPVDVEESSFRRDTKDFYVILGNGAAGYSAAAEIRKRDKTASVILVSEENYLSYNRPMLTKSIMADLDAGQIAIQGEEWYKEQNITLLLGKKVSAIHPEEKEIVLEDGMKFVYTKLIYALGAECFIPPFEGREQDGVIAIRRLDDTKEIAARLPVKHAVVIGGGVLGLEAAWELHKSGCKVTVLESAPLLMGRQLDEPAGELLKKISEGQGIQIRTSVQISAIEGTETKDAETEGRRAESTKAVSAVSGVRLADGEVVPAELVVISCGVRANTGLAKEAGILTNRGVLVNEKMETNVKDIYACGDCAEYAGTNLAVWPEAVEQGKTAGANAAGEETEYKPVSATLSFHGMHTALFAAGDAGKNPNLVYKTIELKDMGKKQYQKYYFLNNRFCGAILIGDTRPMAKVTEALENHTAYQEFIRQIVL